MLIDRQANMDLKSIKINGRYIIQDGKLVLFNSGSGKTLSFHFKRSEERRVGKEC